MKQTTILPHERRKQTTSIILISTFSPFQLPVATAETRAPLRPQPESPFKTQPTTGLQRLDLVGLWLLSQTVMQSPQGQELCQDKLLSTCLNFCSVFFSCAHPSSVKGSGWRLGKLRAIPTANWYTMVYQSQGSQAEGDELRSLLLCVCRWSGLHTFAWSAVHTCSRKGSTEVAGQIL